MSLQLRKNTKRFEILAAIDLCGVETRIAIATPKMVHRDSFVIESDKTNILLDKDEKFVAFGIKATDIWYHQTSMRDDDENSDDSSDGSGDDCRSDNNEEVDYKPKYIYFENFTKNLYSM